MRRKLIKVKAKHIKQGKISCYNKCPVALAINDTPWLVAADVNYGRISFCDVHDVPVLIRKVDLPRSVLRFITKLDTKGKKYVKPFNFYLRY